LAETYEYPSALVDELLTTTENLFLEKGVKETTLETVSQRCGVSLAEVEELYPTAMDLQVAMLNREFTRMYRGIMENVERDPRGGLLSRMYTYILTQVYERPVARTLFMIDRSALHELMTHQYARVYLPSVQIRRELAEKLQEVGMIKPGVDPGLVSSCMTVISGGLALTAPHANLDEIVEALMKMFGQEFDADVSDTRAGKALFYDWATSLETATRDEPLGYG
jgi:AcrR family transcriptional regulator